ncbi:MAG: V-type ATPase subunit [Treponema sp.]|jgi:vacuolar-type H+-ATPase subunit C/Vma6|nr:V-type ATPase subunit [Treponema sp.]
MPGMGERAYVYAKACGIIGKSFVGKRISGLGSVSRLSELDRLVFPQTGRNLPERELLLDLEDRIIGRAVQQCITIVDSYSKPPELLVRLIRTYEYADLKAALNALASGETKNPGFTDIGHFRTVKFEAYPDLGAMIGGTEFEFLLKEPIQSDKNADRMLLQMKLDRHYYTSLWETLFALSRKDRVSIEKILSEEISLRNAVWALRLRTYYSMSAEVVREKLLSIGRKKPRAEGGKPSDTMAADALASLAMALDSRSDWVGWKREAFLNPEKPDEHWKVDPRYFQNAAAEYLYRLARISFHLQPFSIDTSFCFIKLKQFEEDLLTSVAEGLGFGMSSRDVFTLLEMES